ncbi:MAG: hypothetical protein OEY04_16395, partial [Gammaproteobacteria bacterium]|nr:hypothetical protein [Gammaproteobacteria bacterium]
MDAVRIIFRPWYWLAGKIFSVWARPSVQPDDPAELLAGQYARVCYVLETGGLADTLALERVCKAHGLPSPSSELDFCGIHERSSVVVMRRKSGFIFRKPRVVGSARLQRIVDAAVATDDSELLLIPVAIYWGRSPDKQRSWFKLLFSEDWDVMGRT